MSMQQIMKTGRPLLHCELFFCPFMQFYISPRRVVKRLVCQNHLCFHFMKSSGIELTDDNKRGDSNLVFL